MLQPMDIMPTISAYAYMNGHHNFNKLPLSPMRYTFLLHNKPELLKSWDTQASRGFYIETSRYPTEVIKFG